MSDLIRFHFGGHRGSSVPELGFWCAFTLLGVYFRSFFFLSHLALDMELGAFSMHAHEAIILLSFNMSVLGPSFTVRQVRSHSKVSSSLTSVNGCWQFCALSSLLLFSNCPLCFG